MQVPKTHRQCVQPTEYLKLGGFLMVQQTFASAEGASFWGWGGGGGGVGVGGMSPLRKF